MADQVKREIALAQKGAHPLASWGDPQVIDQIVRRLRSMLPNSSKLSDDQILAGAQRALLEGKNPFNGELYISDRVGVVDGYRGIQKDADPSRFYTQTRQMTPDEREEHALGQQDIGYVCLLWDFEKKRRCDDLGIPYEPTKGIGIVFSHERQKSHAPVGRTWAWVAQKRAYKDALRMSGLPYIDEPEVEALRMQVEAQGIDTTGAETGPQILQIAAQHEALEESRRRHQEYLDAVEANFGPEAREEVAKAVVAEDIDDLFGEAEPASTSEPQAGPPRFWDVPDAWVNRLVERANEATGGYYRHLMHVENTLKKEGFTRITQANITKALQTLIAHAGEKQVSDDRAQAAQEADAEAPATEQPSLLPEEPEHVPLDEPADS